LDSSALKNTVERTFGMIKPEGLTRNLVEEILHRIREAGLEVEQKKEITLTVEQYTLLYGHIKQKQPRIYEPMKAYLTSNPCIVLVVKGRNAVTKLLEVRGSSNPADSSLGTIRGDYAKDQDYARCYDQGKPSLNVFHASDTKVEAERDINAFFGTLPPLDSKVHGDYFYSKSTGLYVSRKPVVIDARIKAAADRAGIQLDWDDEGRITRTTFNEARSLLTALEAQMLTPVEYWKVLCDAEDANDTDMIRELTSNRYAEWLNRVYFKDHTCIDNPHIQGMYDFSGERKPANPPYGGPGWFNPEDNINWETGEPVHVEQDREKFATSWKYWSPDIGLAAAPERAATCPVRGYVTSVGKPSFDLGLPNDVRYVKLMIRECRITPLSPPIDAALLEKAEHLVAENDETGLVEFVKQNGRLFAKSKDTIVYKLREKMFDLLGEFSFRRDVKAAAKQLSGNAQDRQQQETFESFISNSRGRLLEALEQQRDIVLVMGHKNPDTDSVISTMFEAWRNHLIDGETTTYVPVVQANHMPSEVTRLLKHLANAPIFTADDLYTRTKASGLARWISVDQNREPEVQKYFITIVDHHMVSETARNRDLPKTLEMVGSSTALVARKMLGMGLNISRDEARILYGATLMDTENRVVHKMTPQDELIMNYLKARAGIKSDSAFYRNLMAQLLSSNDAETLFHRDYKEDWGFGFAVAKVRGSNPKLVARLCELARKNTADKNLPLTLVKVACYDDDCETVHHESMYFIFHTQSTPKFRATIRHLIECIIKFEFPSDHVETNTTGEQVTFWGSGMQLSRKKTAPIIQPVVTAFNRYFSSPSTGLWVKRNFLKYTEPIQNAAPGLSTDTEGRINYITLPEAKELAKKLHFELLSIQEFWKVLKDAKSVNDIQMIESLQGSNFVEFWDTAIINSKLMIDHPEIVQSEVLGEKRAVKVPPGKPGLIHPNEIDTETGLPTRVELPNIYNDPTLWRYWEPDADLVFPCRSYIFLLGQPSWDGKFHIRDSFPNLGLRPVTRTVKEPNVTITWDDTFLTVELFEEGEHKTFKWPKKISDYLDIE